MTGLWLLRNINVTQLLKSQSKNKDESTDCLCYVATYLFDNLLYFFSHKSYVLFTQRRQVALIGG